MLFQTHIYKYKKLHYQLIKICNRHEIAIIGEENNFELYDILLLDGIYTITVLYKHIFL